MRYLALVFLLASCNRIGFEGIQRDDAGWGDGVVSGAGDAAPAGDRVPGPPLLYWCNTDNEVGIVDLRDGTTTQLPDLRAGTYGMELRPADGLLYYFDWGNNDARRYDPQSGQDELLGAYPSGELISRLVFDESGLLWAMSNDTSRLYVFDVDDSGYPESGQLMGDYSADIDFGGDLTFLDDATLLIADRTGRLFLLDRNSTPPVITATIPVAGWSGEAWTGVVFMDGVLYGSTLQGEIYEIDWTAGTATLMWAIPYQVNELSAGR